MIARLAMSLPFVFAVPDHTEFRLHDYEMADGLLVREYPPSKTDLPVEHVPETLTVNGVPAYLANGLRIDFFRDSFDRRQGKKTMDPPQEVVMHCAELLVNRLRFVLKAPGVQFHLLQTTNWNLHYLRDDETEFEHEDGLVRIVWSRGLNWSVTAVTPQAWDAMNELDVDFEAPAWETLLLDASALLPNLGASIVLAATALEVFVAKVLDDLARQSTGLRVDVWDWINSRDWTKAPSTEEQFDALLRILCGHSLQENEALWTSFKHLRKARNVFVHEGRTTIAGQSATPQSTGELISRSREIIARVREWIPESLRWPAPTISAEIKTRHDVRAIVLGPNWKKQGSAEEK